MKFSKMNGTIFFIAPQKQFFKISFQYQSLKSLGKYSFVSFIYFIEYFKLFESKSFLESILINGEQSENRKIKSKTPFKKGFFGFIKLFIKDLVENTKNCKVSEELLSKSLIFQ